MLVGGDVFIELSAWQSRCCFRRFMHACICVCGIAATSIAIATATIADTAATAATVAATVAATASGIEPSFCKLVGV